DWRVNSTDVRPGGYLELATIGSGRLDMKLAIADMRITLAGKTVEIAYREQKLGVVDVPFKEKNIPIKIPIDGAFLIVNLKMKAELIHRAGISQPSLSQKQSEMNETARFSIRVEEPKGARLVYAQNLNATISTSISIDGILSTQDLPIQTYTLYPEEELIELIALP
ncbi:MAG: hypothetical protein QXF26_09040, partial [Candidatus Bathyarchaeia archaeon]